MTPTKAQARFTGVLYLLMVIPAFYSLSVSRRLVVSADAAATARNVMAAEGTYRFALVALLFSTIFMLLLVLSLNNLLREVDRRQARAMVVLAAVMVAVGLANAIHQLAPLVLMSNAEMLSVFSKPQLDALALGFLKLGTLGTYFDMAFWGLWLFPFGVLVFKSGVFPKVLGVLLIIGCFAYLTVSVTGILWPAHVSGVNQVMLPFYAVGELFMMLWLLIRGVNQQPLATRVAS